MPFWRSGKYIYFLKFTTYKFMYIYSFFRFGLRRHKLCCHNYNLPEKYLQLIGSMATYEDSNNDEGKIIEDALKLLS